MADMIEINSKQERAISNQAESLRDALKYFVVHNYQIQIAFQTCFNSVQDHRKTRRLITRDELLDFLVCEHLLRPVNNALFTNSGKNEVNEIISSFWKTVRRVAEEIREGNVRNFG